MALIQETAGSQIENADLAKSGEPIVEEAPIVEARQIVDWGCFEFERGVGV